MEAVIIGQIHHISFTNTIIVSQERPIYYTQVPMHSVPIAHLTNHIFIELTMPDTKQKCNTYIGSEFCE